MSPEQARGDVVDARSDIYSLGVVGFFALSGRLPFHATSEEGFLEKHITEPAPSLATIAPTVPPRAAAIVDRCDDMPEEICDLPLRAGRDRRVDSGGARGRSECATFATERSAVLGVVHSGRGYLRDFEQFGAVLAGKIQI